jgi:hypothetical protein
LDCNEGDVLIHHHSHHGAQIKDNMESDGLAEVWCPDDFNWSPSNMITDDWMSELLWTNLPKGVRYVDIADCCHAGDSLRCLNLYMADETAKFIPNPEVQKMKGQEVILRITGHHSGIQMAACRSGQTSADAFIENQYCGAFTYYFLKAWDQLQNPFYNQLVDRTAYLLAENHFEQIPELDCLNDVSTIEFLK